ncbi:hypothetical protein AN401_07220 [Zobellella denitrificans]|uniref:Phage virion morphogenesis protein n=1 Tax=Zobellella denitrificans TaxID=347534 RepID=A0A291HNF6_9GAMM|nr:phage virion morphogenesis protein [Zobellella denitrificans]ATG73673.1 hypothetical protein AN401_07220 [Zobellella denitrificans]
MSEVQVTLVGQEEVIATLNRLVGAMDDATPAMFDVGEYLIASTRDRFLRGESPDGVAWEPTSQTTLQAYLDRGDRADPRPLFGPSGRLHSEILSFPDATSVTVGSALIYAAVMHYGASQGEFGTSSRGGPIPWGDIPARPFLGISAEDGRQILAILNEYLQGVI